MRNSQQRPTPFFGWFEAGADMLAAQLSKVTASVNHKIDESHQIFDELQHRGEDIDAKLRANLRPQAVIGMVQDALTHNPLVNVIMPKRSQQRKREEQLDLLSAKVDILVEHVALLAAKSAAAKAQAEQKAKAEQEAKAKAKVDTPTAPAAATKAASKQTATTSQKANAAASPAKNTVTAAAEKSSTTTKKTTANRRKPVSAGRRATTSSTKK